MSIDMKNLKKAAPAQKEKLKAHMEAFENNVRAIGQRAAKDRDEYGLSNGDIAAISGLNTKVVREFLNGNTVPHIVNVLAICGAIRVLINSKKLRVVNGGAKKRKAPETFSDSDFGEDADMDEDMDDYSLDMAIGE